MNSDLKTETQSLEEFKQELTKYLEFFKKSQKKHPKVVYQMIFRAKTLIENFNLLVR